MTRFAAAALLCAAPFLLANPASADPRAPRAGATVVEPTTVAVVTPQGPRPARGGHVASQATAALTPAEARRPKAGGTATTAQHGRGPASLCASDPDCGLEVALGN